MKQLGKKGGKKSKRKLSSIEAKRIRAERERKRFKKQVVLCQKNTN